MLHCFLYGIKTTHTPDYMFRQPGGKPQWLLMRFHTPFFYESHGVYREGAAGEFLLCPPDTPLIHGSLPGAKEGFVNDWIYFEGEEADALVYQSAVPVGQAFVLPVPDIFGDSMGRIHRELSACAAGYRYMISACLTELIVELGRAWGEAQHRVSPSYVVLGKIRTEMLENCHLPWTLADLAARTGYSVSRFCGLYKLYYGTTPMDDLIRRRILKARQLLLGGQHSVTEVAALCGFSSIHYFSSAFKRYAGCTPSQFAAR